MRLPLFFRDIAGCNIDATTIKTIVVEHKAYKVNEKFIILDTGSTTVPIKAYSKR